MERKDTWTLELFPFESQMLETGQIDLRFEITENNKFTVNSIQVRGNDKTKTTAIVRELSPCAWRNFRFGYGWRRAKHDYVIPVFSKK